SQEDVPVNTTTGWLKATRPVAVILMNSGYCELRKGRQRPGFRNQRPQLTGTKCRLHLVRHLALVPLHGLFQTFSELDQRSVAEGFLGFRDVGERLADVSIPLRSVQRRRVATDDLPQHRVQLIDAKVPAGGNVESAAAR